MRAMKGFYCEMNNGLHNIAHLQLDQSHSLADGNAYYPPLQCNNWLGLIMLIIPQYSLHILYCKLIDYI